MKEEKKMSSKHVISQFLEWFEKRLPEDERRAVENHLEHCAKCRNYYSKMASLVQTPDKDTFPVLEADPYLATRVKAAAKKNTRSTALSHWFRWAVVGAASSFAIFLGVELGNGLYTATQTETGTEVATTYYQAFSQTGIADQWQDVIQTNEDTNQ